MLVARPIVAVFAALMLSCASAALAQSGGGGGSAGGSGGAGGGAAGTGGTAGASSGMGSGGSIPVVEALRRRLGLDSLLMGFALDDDQTHSPNEKFELRCFHHGIRSHIRLLGRLAAAA